MPYILNKTNGAKLTVVNDAEVNSSTDLFFIGKNYSGYGELFNENFLRLLENFSNNSAPPKPIAGQLWFNTTANEKRLSVYDGKKFKTLANLEVSSSQIQSPQLGDLWWDKNASKLKVYDGKSFKEIGPDVSERADFITVNEIYDAIDNLNNPVIKGVFEGNDRVVFSDAEFTPIIEGSLYSTFSKIKKGITLYGADPTTGSSKSTGYYFWGTSAEALVATTATTTKVEFTNTNTTFYVPFVNSTTGNVSYYANSNISFNPSSGILNTIASAAQYADLAERYNADNNYESGTVVIIGGPNEITVTHTRADKAVLGVVSTNPAYRMNSETGTDESHPYVALRGRVPCKVIGPVKKGDLLVTSYYPGYAEVFKTGDSSSAVLGKSLENFDGSKGTIEIVV